jgi:hypothetical protein
MCCPEYIINFQFLNKENFTPLHSDYLDEDEWSFDDDDLEELTLKTNWRDFWYNLSSNPGAFPILEQNINKINWGNLASNPNIWMLNKTILQKNIDIQFCSMLPYNKHAVEIIRNNLHMIGVTSLPHNENPAAIRLIEEHFEKFCEQNTMYNPHNSLYHFEVLSRNPFALPLLEKHPDKINWKGFSSNPNPKMIPLLETYLEKKYVHAESLDWYNLSKNPYAISILEKHLDKVNWDGLSLNPNAISIIEQHLDKANRYKLCLNPNPDILSLLERNLDNVDWKELCSNPNAIPLIERHLDMLTNDHWYVLCSNPNAVPLLERNVEKLNHPSYWRELSSNPNAVPLLEKHFDKINWHRFSKNPNAVHVLKQNLDKISRMGLAFNPNIVPVLGRLYTKKMRENCKAFAEELTAYVFHPARLARICEAYGLELEEYFEIV